jgi:hypothetical protein
VAGAQTGPSIFTCTAPSGRVITSDRLIAECMDREQRVLNRDGSLQRIVPASLTADERSAKEARERQIAAQKLAMADAVRRDRNLLQRYPNEATHQKAREAALESVREAMRASESRLKELASERKPLLDEAEFYKGKALPAKLKQQLDANDASAEAQRASVQTQQAELDRVNGLFDAELVRLKRLWAGAAPGSFASPLQNAQASNGVPGKASN